VDLRKTILEFNDNGVKVEDKIYDESLRGISDGQMTFVDKFTHVGNIRRGNDSNSFLIIFSRRKMYKALKTDLNLTFIEFSNILNDSKYSIEWDNALKNYRYGHDTSLTPIAIFKKYIGEDKEDFGAIKINLGKYGNL
jgi:hypothetical protein